MEFATKSASECECDGLVHSALVSAGFQPYLVAAFRGLIARTPFCALALSHFCLFLKFWFSGLVGDFPKGPKIENNQDRPPGLKFSTKIGNFNRAAQQTPIFVGEFWWSGLKISIEIEFFKQDWNFQSRSNFFNLWALRVQNPRQTRCAPNSGWNAFRLFRAELEGVS